MKNSWTISAGENARLTPQGPWAGQVVSQDTLPLRIPIEASANHAHPTFPGSALLLGETTFEVKTERFEPEVGYLYDLALWNQDLLFRDPVAYGAAWLAPIFRWRRQAALREKLPYYSWPLLPLVGLLPEDQQIPLCWQLNLNPRLATVLSCVLEWLSYLLLFGLFKAQFGDIVALVVGLPLFALFMAPVTLRFIFALLFAEVAGAMPINCLYEASQDLIPIAQQFSKGPRPLTRNKFWQRLNSTDLIEPQENGGVLLISRLPHLVWSEEKRHREGQTQYMVTALDPLVDGHDYLFAYQMFPLRHKVFGDKVEVEPVKGTSYRDMILVDLDQQWQKIVDLFPSMVSILPRAMQQRALGDAGPEGIRPAALRTAGVSLLMGLACALAASWTQVGAGAMGFLFMAGAVLGLEGLWRLITIFQGKFAPSLLGLMIADLVPPERALYLSHQRAEQTALAQKQTRTL